MSLKTTSFPNEVWQKPFIFRAKQIKRNLRHSFVDKRQLKTIMPKQAFSRIYLVPPCSSKLVLFIKFSFREIYFSDKVWERRFFLNRKNLFGNLFDIPLPIYFFTKEHSLKTSNKRTHIPLLINQFVSILELKMERLINHWTNTCKIKLDEMTYSKSWSETPYDVSKNKPWLYP